MKYVLPICLLLALWLTFPAATHAGEAAVRRQVVIVHVELIELSLTKLRRLGVDVTPLGNDPRLQPNATKNDNGLLRPQVMDGGKARLLVDALCKKCPGKMLAGPTIEIVSGETADFNVGDYTPINMKEKVGPIWEEAVVTTPNRQSGVKLTVTPEVLDDQTIRLAVYLRTAEPVSDSVTGASNDGHPSYQISEIRKIEIRTNMQLRNGETVRFAGPVNTYAESVAVGLPWISEIPYVGALFRRVKEERNQIQTFLFVRAEIVPPGTTPPIATTSPESITPDAPAAVLEEQTVRPVSYDAPPTIVPQPGERVIRR